MDKRYRSKGLRMIGAEAQNSPQASIDAVVKKHKVDFAIVTGARSPIQFSGIPRMFVFDVDGKLVFNGRPSEADSIIKKELRRVEVAEEEDDVFARPKMLVEERDWLNADGNKLTAALVSVEDGVGTFRKPTGATFDYPLEKLSEADRALAREASTPREEAE